MKQLRDFLDNKGYLIQKKVPTATRYNAIDSNFLNSNTIYQQLLVNDTPKLRKKANNFLRDFQHEPGVLRRYYKNDINVQINDYELNDECPYWKNPLTVSRDNSMGFIVLAGYMGRHDIMRKFALKTLMRGSFFQNKMTVKWEKKPIPDICGLGTWSTLLRSCFTKKQLYFMYPLLLILDFFFMLNLLFDTAFSYYDPDDCSTIYHTMSAIYQKKLTIETPFSFLGSLIYVNYRQSPPGFEKDHNIVGCLKHYSDASYDPPIDQITQALLEKR